MTEFIIEMLPGHFAVQFSHISNDMNFVVSDWSLIDEAPVCSVNGTSFSLQRYSWLQILGQEPALMNYRVIQNLLIEN